MKIITLEEAQSIVDGSFIDPAEAPKLEVQDEHDRFVDLDGTLVWANLLDQLADEWDPVDGCWMEFDGGEFEDIEDFWDALEEEIE